MLASFFTAQDNLNFDMRANEIRNLIKKIEENENKIENETPQRYWAAISSSFASLLALTGLTAVNPVIGAVAITVSLTGTAVTIGGAIMKNSESHPEREKLKRYRIALKSQTPADWAAIWALAGKELFIDCLYDAAQGVVEDNNLVRSDNKNALAAALDVIADSQGLTREEVIKKVKAIKETKKIPQTEGTENTRLENAENTRLENTENTRLQDRENTRLENAENTRLENAENTRLENAENTRLQDTRKSPNLSDLMNLSLAERGLAVIDLLDKSGFEIGRCIQRQVTVIAGSQRGGKGTLMGILAILSKAIKPGLKIHYFSAGNDIYPFECDKAVNADSYPFMEEPDAKVASDLINYLKDLERAPNGSCTDRIIVIDEAVALYEYIDEENITWSIKFLLTRAAKKGARIFIVLHGSNLTSWTGAGKTGGYSNTFKTGVSLIGCEARSIKISPLETRDEATGKYFLADFDNFSKSVQGGELGTLPDWIKTEINPISGAPDPVRTLLTIFPEYNTEKNIEIKKEETKVDESISVVTEEEIIGDTLTEINTETDFDFICRVANEVRSYLIESEVTVTDIEKIRKIRRLKDLTQSNKGINTNQAKAVTKFLSMTGFLIETSNGEYEILYKG